ncbi:MAG: histidinol-phosphatase, partial [Fidelibacterota bacterium]
MVRYLAIPVIAGLISICHGQYSTRSEINVPDILGFKTLKCDFHVHTVFSDGSVWPPIRIIEAWQEGLDAIALTEHLEHQPHREDIPTHHGRSIELASQRAQEFDLILIKGAEITRSMPPGHFNAIFIEDIDLLVRVNYQDAIKAAIDQGAFVFWNHPGWRQPETIPRWYAVHDTLLQEGWMHGIEVANDREYYPLAVRWALEKR